MSNRSVRENMELAGLAHRRYPDMPLDLAIEFFCSDRRHAGLGALDERKRKGRGEIRNYKCRDWQSDNRILYCRRIDRPARLVFPKYDPMPGPYDIAANLVIVMETVPAAKAGLNLPVSWDLLGTQSGRRHVAQELRRMRREMQKSLASQ